MVSHPSDSSAEIRPFRIAIAQDDLDDLRDRLARAFFRLVHERRDGIGSDLRLAT